ncbi:unnamed protein product [Aphanomyces euteiches]|uniref:BZIP domain-containing protein n=1 Tax=Aphanomyces euteiches TaxID=100861 RepID=A0A6G0XUE9_9STRA|nr:hypothetical protein Ae201684_001284 [Aphanomyces euteiches]KAH9100031.1 hypothetical protein Ae201684P_019036 [Aphanomyces euteiches]KAH9135727.1 hypothetical protein AeRB84_018943 [Aphanomyces euteiches]
MRSQVNCLDSTHNVDNMMKHELVSMLPAASVSNGSVPAVTSHLHQMQLHTSMQSLLRSGGPTKAHSPPKPTKDTSKKVKVSRERQLKINAASRKCRRKQKVELQFLRSHVVDLRKAMRDHAKLCPNMNTTLLDQTEHQMEELTSVTTRVSRDDSDSDDESTVKSTPLPTATLVPPSPGRAEATSSTTFADGKTKEELVTIGTFLRMNLNMESKSFSPDSISSLPIQMDGWRIRLSITERNYAFHNQKFFPSCSPKDLFDFCWETSLNETQMCLHPSEYFKVTRLSDDMAYLASRTIGQWSLLVHGVPNVSYNSILTRMTDGNRLLVCQQSVLGPQDFADPTTEPWLFKKWVVFQPTIVNGVAGTSVESYRCASYASGRRLYSETNTYDSFCEHIIRRYAESNVVLDRMMAQDGRFAHLTWNEHNLFLFETMGERVVKDFLLF